MWLIAIVFLLMVFFICSHRDTKRKAFLFYGDSLHKKLFPADNYKVNAVKATLILVAIVLMVAALLRPQWGFKWIEKKHEGADILIALDVSESMLAGDLEPNRLERAKLEIKDMLKIAGGDRVGLMVFSGDAFLVCPLTLDYGTVAAFLDDINTDTLSAEGTAFDRAIRRSINAFDMKKNNSKAVIFLTDGEDHSAEMSLAVDDAVKNKIRIFCVAMGTEKGAPIPMKDGVFKKDSYGNVIVTRLSLEPLKAMAVKTGGSFVIGELYNNTLEELYNGDIRKMPGSKEQSGEKEKKWNERYKLFLIPAFVLLILEYFYQGGAVINGKEKRWKFSFLILLAILYSGNAESSVLSGDMTNIFESYNGEKYEDVLEKLSMEEIESPQNVYIKYNIGNCLYNLKRYRDSEKYYKLVVKMSADRVLMEKSFYNMGNAFFREGKILEAIKAYSEALAIDGNDSDAAYNLEFAKKKLESISKKETSSVKNAMNENDKTQNLMKEDKKMNDDRNPDLSSKDSGSTNTSKLNEGRDETATTKRSISRAEADAFLGSITDSKKKVLSRQIQSGFPSSQPGTDKDW